ncbi:Pentatricopeptide repeat-containing protein [Nymphaea thermarum]|nr:Pentatricopeptide repeat-containing protein [Nymphaea thermarum]
MLRRQHGSHVRSEVSESQSFEHDPKVEAARKIFDKLQEKSPAIWNAMITGYAQNGRTESARKLFDIMPARDAVSWNAMLAAYTQNGEMNSAVRLFEEMVSRDDVSWNLMIAGFVEVGNMASACNFFEKMPMPNVVSWVTMLSGYAQNGEIEKARETFSKMPERNVVAWNAMAAGYVQNGRIKDAYEVFCRMPARNASSWAAMITGFAQVCKLDEAKRLLDAMPFNSVISQTAMISGYIQSGRLEDAWKMFVQIKCPDTVCWNTMIAGYAQYGKMDDAHSLFRKMKKKDVISWNTMISGYCQIGKMPEAIQMFEEMGQRNAVSWNSIISGMTQNGLYSDALRYFVLMLRDGKRPDESTYASALCSGANLAVLQHGKQLHDLVVKSGRNADVFVGNSLITMYAKCGRVLRAKQVFSEMVNIDSISWNALIAGYALHGYANEALVLFMQMQQSGEVPDEVTLVAVLSACSHAGLIDEGLYIFHSMVVKYNIVPIAEHYSCVVDLLGRSGRLEEAYELVVNMPIEANAGTYGALLGASYIRCNLEIGTFAGEKLLKLEPHKTSNYVLLSNMHAASGRWEEVERIRMLMKERGVEKLPGSSWIEIKGRVHSFSAVNFSHELIAEICSTLWTLSTQTKTDGHEPDLRYSFLDLG